MKEVFEEIRLHIGNVDIVPEEHVQSFFTYYS